MSIVLNQQELASLTDQEVLDQCQHYGSQAKLWKQKFLGLLPEVERRRLYVRRGCSSVFEFAAKLGGVSREQVLVVLRLDQRFESTPVLKQALVSGDISINKLARVVSVATPENQRFWATQSQLLSQAGLETLVRDSKSLRAQTLKPNKTEKVVQSDELNLDKDIRQELLEIQNKGLDVNQILRDALRQRKEKIQEEKQRIAKELEQPVSRYIPLKIKKIIKQEYGNKCAHSNCHNQATNIHHTRRFALHSSHNPLYLAPLCKFHHEIAHAIDVKSVQKRNQMGLATNHRR